MLTRMGLDSIVHGRISFVRYPHSQTSGQGLQAIKECRIAGISATGKEQRTSTNKMLTRDKKTWWIMWIWPWRRMTSYDERWSKGNSNLCLRHGSRRSKSPSHTKPQWTVFNGVRGCDDHWRQQDHCRASAKIRNTQLMWFREWLHKYWLNMHKYA